MVALAEEAEGLALKVEEGGDGLEEEVGALKVRLGLIHVVGVLQEQASDAEPGLYFDDGQEGDCALAYRLQALYGLPNFPLLLFMIRQQPQPLGNLFHLPLTFSSSTVYLRFTEILIQDSRALSVRMKKKKRRRWEVRATAAAVGWASTSKVKPEVGRGAAGWINQILTRFYGGSLFFSSSRLHSAPQARCFPHKSHPSC